MSRWQSRPRKLVSVSRAEERRRRHRSNGFGGLAGGTLGILAAERLESRDLLAVVTFEFTARVDDVGDPGNLLQGQLVAGQVLRGRFSFDDSLTDDDPDASLGSYLVAPGPGNDLFASNGTIGFQTHDDFPALFAVNNTSNFDSFDLFYGGDSIPSTIGLPGVDFVEVDISLRDFDGTAFTSDALPTSLNLSDFESRTFEAFAEDLAGTANPFVIDGTILSITPVTGIDYSPFATRLFTDLLGRAPTPTELDALVDPLEGGASRPSVVAGLVNSATYLNEVIEGFYAEYLGRIVDAGGLNFWRSQLAGGRNPQAVLADILASDEYFTLQGGTNSGFVDGLYADLLGRSNDSSGAAFWTGLLNGGSGRTGIILGFASSQEFSLLLVDDPADVLGTVGGWYQTFLGRDADGGSAQFWAKIVAGGHWNAVLTGILASDEYFGLQVSA